MYKIGIDAMGGDNAPKEIVKGVVDAVKSNKSIEIYLIGDAEVISKELKSFVSERLILVNATEVIENEDSPAKAIKNKSDSSMVVGLKLLKEKKIDAFISAGNTGALLTGATIIVGRIKGVKRPALSNFLPNKNGATCLVDCGANMDSKPEYLLQYGIMGSVYVETMLGIEEPKVSLVNVGTEETKGNEVTKEAYKLLKNSNLNFIGNIEAREIPKGTTDVLVCDAFVGNVILKLSEGYFKAFASAVQSQFKKPKKAVKKLVKTKLKPEETKETYDYSEISGTLFLGLDGVVVKAHGNANAKDIKIAIKQTLFFVKSDIVNKTKIAIKEN